MLIILLVGLGTRATALAGLAMLGAHAMFKAALFLVVGVVDAATGTRDLRRLSGVGRELKITALAGASVVHELRTANAARARVGATRRHSAPTPRRRAG